MEKFSALLALCARNSPGTGEFPAQRPVTRSFDVFFDLCLNKRLRNNREAGDLRRHQAHYDVTVMDNHVLQNTKANKLPFNMCVAVISLIQIHLSMYDVNV